MPRLAKPLTDAQRAAKRASLRKWQAANREKARAASKSWADRNRERRREYRKEWRAANAEHLRVYGRKRYAANPEKTIDSTKAWQAANRPKVRAVKAAWAKRNPGYVNAKTAARRKGVAKATPPWVDHEEIRAVYKLAAFLGWHVDHIHPLKGENFSGLHVPWNLQVIAPEVNYRKSNKLLPEYVS